MCHDAKTLHSRKRRNLYSPVLRLFAINCDTIVINRPIETSSIKENAEIVSRLTQTGDGDANGNYYDKELAHDSWYLGTLCIIWYKTYLRLIFQRNVSSVLASVSTTRKDSTRITRAYTT